LSPANNSEDEPLLDEEANALFHRARLWLRHARSCDADSTHARRLVHEVLAEAAEPRFEAFLAITRWTVRRISERDGDSGTCAGAMLAAVWSHAAEVFHALAAHDPRWDGLRESFSARSGPQAEYFFAPEEPLRSDAAHPRSLDRISTLVHACAATVLAEDPSVAADFGITAFADAGFFVTEEGRRVPQIILRENPAVFQTASIRSSDKTGVSHSRRRSGRKAPHPSVP